jgi:hypothetical protein
MVDLPDAGLEDVAPDLALAGVRDRLVVLDELWAR